MLALPAAVALAVLSVPLVTSLFHYGAFAEHDVWMTRQALMAYSLGLLGLILVKVLAPAFYARQNVKTPVKIALFTLLATQLMNLLFVGWLHHAGLALAIGLGACINASLLYYYLRRAGTYQPLPGWAAFLLRVLLALILMGLALWFAAGTSASWLHADLWHKLLKLSGLVALGVLVYFGSLWVLGLRIHDFIKRAA